MRCEEVQAALGDTEGVESAEVRAHVNGCADCQAYARDLTGLNALLDADSDEPVRPGFDTRFFALLEEEKTRSRRGFLGRFGWMFAGAATAAAALAGVVLYRGKNENELEAEELELALHLDLLEDLDVVKNLEDVEAFELLAEVDDLDALLEQGG